MFRRANRRKDRALPETAALLIASYVVHRRHTLELLTERVKADLIAFQEVSGQAAVREPVCGQHRAPARARTA